MSIEPRRRTRARPAAPRPNRAEAVARRIEREIVRGTWTPGSRLPGELELCRRHRASRPVVREALQGLKARGLIASRRGSGSYLLRDPGSNGMGEMISLYAALRRDAPSFRELFDLRLLVETFCVRNLADARDPETLAQVGRRLDAMERSAGDLKKFARADIDFHLALVELSGHRLFGRIMRGLMSDLGRRFAERTYTDASLVPANLADHRAIARRIARGDGAGAAKRLSTHLARSRRHLEALIGNGQRA